MHAAEEYFYADMRWLDHGVGSSCGVNQGAEAVWNFNCGYIAVNLMNRLAITSETLRLRDQE
jgi:hypothetical protein